MNKTEKENQSHKKHKEGKKPDTNSPMADSSRSHTSPESDVENEDIDASVSSGSSSAKSDTNTGQENDHMKPSSDVSEEFNQDEHNKEETSNLKEQVSQLNDKYLRLVAEFDNFRKRTSKERSELFKTANKDVLVAIIPVVDDFERAEKAMSTAKDPAAIKEGLLLISGKLKNILAQQGLKEMKSIGEPFDTDKHEAVTNIPAGSEEMKGKVIDEVEKGYTLNEKVIRYAKVIVGE